MTMEIDTSNICMVGMRGETVVILIPRQELTQKQAIAHAAYLVLMAGDYDATEFAKVFEAVRNT